MPRSKAQERHPFGLNELQARFVVEYLKDLNGTQAYKRAGYKANSSVAANQAAWLLANPKVIAALKAKREQMLTAADLSTERTLREIARIAYFDQRKMMTADGAPIPLHQLDDDTAAALAGMDVLEQYEGVGEDRKLVGLVKKYKIADKNAALEKAAKILGLFEKDNAQKPPAVIQMIDYSALHKPKG
jgi:phage terminase small subunit